MLIRSKSRRKEYDCGERIEEEENGGCLIWKEPKKKIEREITGGLGFNGVEKERGGFGLDSKGRRGGAGVLCLNRETEEGDGFV